MALYASYVLIALPNGGIAAVTWPGEAGRVRLPGGEVEPGETGAEAARRGAHAGGWHIPSYARLTLCHAAVVDGEREEWYEVAEEGDRCHQLTGYDSGRVSPCIASKGEVAGGGHGNAFIALRDDIPDVISLSRREAEALLAECRREGDGDGAARVLEALRWQGERVMLPA